MGFVFYKCGRGEIQDPFECVSDPGSDGGVEGGPVPDAEDVLLEPDADHGAAHLLPHHELLAQHCEHQVLPTPIRQTWINRKSSMNLILIRLYTLSESDYPLATEFVGLVFPHGLDAHLEEVEVGVAGQVPRLDQVAVQTPELLAAPEPPDKSEVLIEIVILFSWTAAGVPQAILGLKSVLTFRYDHWCKGRRLHLEPCY